MNKSFVLLFACVMLTGLSLAAPGPSPETGFSIIQTGTVFQVLYKASKAYDVKVSIYNSTNELVFTEKLEGHDGFNRPYNFVNLGPGEYRIEVEDEKGSSARTVVVPGRKSNKVFNVAPVHGTDGKFLLTVGRSARGFSLVIFDQDGRELYHESKILDGDFAKVYNFSKVRGQVSVVVSDFNGNESKVTF